MNVIKLIKCKRKKVNFYRIGLVYNNVVKEYLGFCDNQKKLFQIKNPQRIIELIQQGNQLSESLKKKIFITGNDFLISNLLTNKDVNNINLKRSIKKS